MGQPPVMLRKPRTRRFLRSLFCCLAAAPGGKRRNDLFARGRSDNYAVDRVADADGGHNRLPNVSTQVRYVEYARAFRLCLEQGC